jgi:hypothetical protein
MIKKMATAAGKGILTMSKGVGEVSKEVGKDAVKREISNEEYSKKSGNPNENVKPKIGENNNPNVNFESIAAQVGMPTKTYRGSPLTTRIVSPLTTRIVSPLTTRVASPIQMGITNPYENEKIKKPEPKMAMPKMKL